MRKADSWFFVVCAVIGMGHYLATDKTIVESYGWIPVLISLLAYFIYSLSNRIDELQRRIAFLEDKSLQADYIRKLEDG
jgi:hypothetical protein